MKTRKTIDLAKLLELTNNYLAYEGSITADMRAGAASLLESALHAGNVYAGFGYLPKWGYKVDETRRIYYTHHNLRD